jgi:DNA-binding HxlR family transcriptional regulator
MKKQTIEKSDEIVAPEPCEGLMPQFQRALGVLAGKWKGEILWQLVQRKHRFGELRQSIPGVTQHMLTTQLRDLEANGLVKRTVYPEVPPRVEYEITPSAGVRRTAQMVAGTRVSDEGAAQGLPPRRKRAPEAATPRPPLISRVG